VGLVGLQGSHRYSVSAMKRQADSSTADIQAIGSWVELWGSLFRIYGSDSAKPRRFFNLPSAEALDVGNSR
jgi:hypothetical protein